MDCKHWKELDNDVEYCKAKWKRCSCSGTRKQCDYPRYFNAMPKQIAKYEAQDSAERTKAQVELYEI